MSGWAAIYGAIFANQQRSSPGLSAQYPTEYYRFKSDCGKYVEFSEFEKDFVKELSTDERTIRYKGITFKFIGRFQRG